jgi:3-dehydroquinate synthase
LKPLIDAAVNQKIKIVEQDPTEKNIRKILNFGHTFGHAFETFALENGYNLSHGHAVAMGMLCELWLSEKLLNFDANLRQEISNYILSIYPKFNFVEGSAVSIQKTDFEHLLEILLQDKKNSNGQIKPTLLERIGDPRHDVICSKELCLEAFLVFFHTFKNF